MRIRNGEGRSGRYPWGSCKDAYQSEGRKKERKSEKKRSKVSTIKKKRERTLVI